MKPIVSTLITAAAGATSKEASVAGIFAAAGTAVSAWFGGWDTAIQVLVALMVLDYATGVLGALKRKAVDSEVMFWGGVRKGVVLAVIILAVMIDRLIGADAPIFRTIAIYFYSGREGLSVVENLGQLGVPMPPGLVKFLEQLKQKGEGETDAKS